VAGHTGCTECRSSKLLGGRSNIGAYKTSEALQQDFVARAKAVHGDSYDYSQVDYRGASQKVKIICPLHGPFCSRRATIFEEISVQIAHN